MRQRRHAEDDTSASTGLPGPPHRLFSGQVARAVAGACVLLFLVYLNFRALTSSTLSSESLYYNEAGSSDVDVNTDANTVEGTSPIKPGLVAEPLAAPPSVAPTPQPTVPQLVLPEGTQSLIIGIGGCGDVNDTATPANENTVTLLLQPRTYEECYKFRVERDLEKREQTYVLPAFAGAVPGLVAVNNPLLGVARCDITLC